MTPKTKAVLCTVGLVIGFPTILMLIVVLLGQIITHSIVAKTIFDIAGFVLCGCIFIYLVIEVWQHCKKKHGVE